MSIFSVVKGLVSPITDLIDNLHTSTEEKLQLRNELKTLENELALQQLKTYETTLKAQSSIITAEAKGDSWLQRSWRPITMLTFLVLVVCDSFGLLSFRLTESAWTLLQIGLGGYVGGRSIEKVAKVIAPVIEKKVKGDR